MSWVKFPRACAVDEFIQDKLHVCMGDVEGPMVCGGGGGGMVGNVFEYGGGQRVVMGGAAVRRGSDTLLYGMSGSVFEIVNEKWIEKIVVFATARE